MILLFRGWNVALATGASKRIVWTLWLELEAEAGVRGLRMGCARTERSHMMAVESRDAVKRNRLFLDQLAKTSARPTIVGLTDHTPQTPDSFDVAFEHPDHAPGLEIPYLDETIATPRCEVVACEWAGGVEADASRLGTKGRVDRVGILLREGIYVKLVSKDRLSGRALTEELLHRCTVGEWSEADDDSGGHSLSFRRKYKMLYFDPAHHWTVLLVNVLYEYSVR